MPCLLNVVHREYNGKTYANIYGVTKMMKGVPAPQGTLPHVTFDLDTDPLEKIADLPEWIQKKIKESVTYKERIAGKGDTAQDEAVSTFEDGFLSDIDYEDGELPF